MTLPDESLEKYIERIPESGCWIWLGAVNQFGYGRAYANGKTTSAHRVVYEALVGPIPDGLIIDHLCRTRCCVNPSHLEPVTQRSNVLRGVGWAAINSKLTHCPQGHPYDRSKSYSGKPVTRFCSICNNRNQIAYRARRDKRIGRVRQKVPARLITFNGEALSLRAWAKRIGIHPRSLSYRLEHWPMEQALTAAPTESRNRCR
jgi:hypothetical protein